MERGGSLSSIEQWLGSRTVSSAFLTQLQLGGFNIIGATMGITWALSPLGAQAVLRIFGTRTLDIVAEASVSYFDTNTPSWFTESGLQPSSPNNGDYPKLMNSIYTAALLSPDSTKSDSQDSWGNIKIPYLNLASHNQNSSDIWIPVPNDETIHFSSLLGLPAVTRPQLGHRVKFAMESSYMELDCSPFVPTAVVGDDLLDFQYPRLYNNRSLLMATSGFSTLKRVENRTWQAITGWSEDYYPWVLALDTFLDPLWFERQMRDLDGFSPAAFVNETGIYTTQARLQLLTWSSSYNTATSTPRATTCWLSQPYIESEVECTWSDSSVGPSCAVVVQRPSQKPHASTNITSLSFQATFSQFSRLMPMASGLQYSYGLSDASILYLINTSSSFLLDPSSRTRGDLSTIPAHDIGPRLGQLLNTYQISSQAFESITNGIPNEDVDNITTAAQTTSTKEVYAINKPWLAVFFVTTLVMLIGSVIGAVFCHISHTPEILGFASSAIRDSKYVKLAPGFGALGGLEMTKAFDGIEFRYGVVYKQDDGQEVMGVSWKVNVERAKKGVAYI